MKKTRTYIFDALVNLIAQSVLPVNIIALTVAAIRGVAEYKIWMSGALIYVYNPLYPIGIAVGTIGITLGFIAVSRLTLRKA